MTKLPPVPAMGNQLFFPNRAEQQYYPAQYTEPPGYYPPANTGGYRAAPSPQMNIKYKTELCRSWLASERCALGDRCLFAHGHQELRTRKCDPRYKTKPCRSFQQHGTCPYNDRCDFLHDESRVPTKPNEFWLVNSRKPARCVQLTTEGAYPLPSNRKGRVQVPPPARVKKMSAWLRRGTWVRMLGLVDQGRAMVRALEAPSPAESAAYYQPEPLLANEEGCLIEFLASFWGSSWLAAQAEKVLARNLCRLDSSLRRRILLFV